jgi:flavin-dependent dehydrogenase
MNIPEIHQLCITSPSGIEFKTTLPLGGIGISRYTLDNNLAVLARAEGVCILENTKVSSVEKHQSTYTLTLIGSGITGNEIHATLCAGSFGKRSNLDVKWKRGFIQKRDKGLDNYIGIKYHLRGKGNDEMISLHNFENGYCGISRIEDDKYCLCYMTKASMLKTHASNIEMMEREVLGRNPALKKVFEHFSKEEGFPVTISQISFQRKSLFENDIIFLGDAAGMITPLCGNGMSMALHASKLLAPLINGFLKKEISFEEMVVMYQKEWKRNFEKRLRIGRILQRFFGNITVTNIFVALIRRFPSLASIIIRQTHGKPF